MTPAGDGLIVAINARAAVRAQIGGVERMARELALRLPALAPDRYVVIRPPRSLAHRAGHAWEQGLLPLLARGAHRILSPANLAPLASRRNVVVIHDAAALRHPDAYSSAYVAYQRRLLPALARRARLLVTVSEFSRGELVELLGADPQRTVVIPGGVDSRFSPGVDPSPARRVFGLTEPYALVVGTPSARKNLGVLDRVGETLAREGVTLVLAGSERGYLRGGSVAVRRLGYVGDALLPALYAGADALLLPSRYEGFGLPALEAMASAVPVVAARAGALPETVGDAGLLVELERPDALAEALLAVLREDTLRARLIAAGTARAREFSWERTARRFDVELQREAERH